MEKYLKIFESRRKEEGIEIYKNNYIKYVIKYNNIYYSKISEEYDYYMVSIDINTFKCQCNDNKSCKHIYATLLSINEKKYTSINLNELSKENLLELINFFINKDLKIIDNIKEFIDKDNKKLSHKDIEKFFNDFESNDFDYVSNDEYEFIDSVLEDYDYTLIKLLKSGLINDEKINIFVVDKLKYYNDYLDDLGLINIFEKTNKYLKNPNNFYTKDDIIKLFSDNYYKAVIEFNKIHDFKEISYIYEKINNENKINLLINKIDNYLMTNKVNNDLYECLILLIFTENCIDEIIKKYGLIIIKYIPHFDTFIKIKSLCDKTELDTILNNIIKINIINNDIFNILYDYKLYDNIFNLIDNNNYYNDKDIIKYCTILVDNIPQKINSLLKKCIEKILNQSSSNYYENVIEYLKIYKNNFCKIEFQEYTNKLLSTHNRKSKFKKLFNDEFQDSIKK
jgi:hypothetical protein